jgi:hypothetical protein
LKFIPTIRPTSCIWSGLLFGEHIFIHLSILLGRISTGTEVANLAETDWPQKFKQTLGLDDLRTKEFYDDQVSLRELLWKSDINFYILPPEYNFNSLETFQYWKKHNFMHAKPVIFHYTENKNEDIESLIRRTLNGKNTDYTPRECFLKTLIRKFMHII